MYKHLAIFTLVIFINTNKTFLSQFFFLNNKAMFNNNANNITNSYNDR